jgi:hypothetical protein
VVNTTATVTRNARNVALVRVFMEGGFVQFGNFLRRMAKSANVAAKQLNDIIGNIRPADMSLLPSDNALGLLAAAATPPPPPWREREMPSQRMKNRVYILAGIEEMFSP